ncbi:MAG: methyltransferase domain-containing protein [Isosphaeraceae bacterium]
MSESVPCNYCEVDEATVVFGPGVAQPNQIVRCNRCGLMYASPRAKVPDHVEIAAYDPAFDPFRPDDSRTLKERLQVKDYDRTRALLNRLYPQRGRLLEVGSSLGYLLDVFKQDGWDVMGVEPFYQACRHSQEELGLDVKNAILETAGLPEASFDVVLLNHVIEHLDDPMGTLREVNRILKPEGHFVIETPRYDTLMFKLLGRRERSLGCLGHIYFFTTRTLRNLYEAAGFKTVQLDYVGRSLTAERLLYNVALISKSPKLKGRLDQLSQRLRLKTWKLHLNFRDMQRVCVQKVSTAAPATRVAETSGACASELG